MNLIYHKLYVEVLTDDTLPFFAGSMLRGAFGPALKQTVCINPSSYEDTRKRKRFALKIKFL